MEKNNIECIKDVIMISTEKRAFTKGKTYTADLDGFEVWAINDMHNLHILGSKSDEDSFFNQHFVIINNSDIEEHIHTIREN